MIAKYDIDPDDFCLCAYVKCGGYCSSAREDVNGKNRTESEKKLKSNLYLCIVDEAQRIFKARKPAVNVKTVKYPRVLDEMQNVFQRERNVTHERGLFYGRKQRKNETFKKFHAELSALAGRCDFANSAENVRDIFIMNMRESDCQRKLSRSPKLQEEVYRIALSYERGERAYKSYTGKPASSAPPITIKQEPVNNIRRGQGYFRGRARGRRGGYTQGSSSGGGGNNRRCYNCDAMRVVLQREQHVIRVGNWDILNAHAEELEKVLTSGGDEDESDW